MENGILVILLMLFILLVNASGLQVKASGCKNTTKPIPFSNGADGGEITIKGNNCSDSVLLEKPLEKPLGKTLNTTVAPLTNIPDNSESGGVVDSLSEIGKEELGESIIDNSIEDDEEDFEADGMLQTTEPHTTENNVLIGEGNLLCPENWVCSIKDGNSTVTKPSGIVMKAIPYIGLSALAIMVVMAVAAALWMNRNKNGNTETFGMNQLPRRKDNMDGYNTVMGDNTVTVNMLALDNNPKGVTATPTDSVRLSRIHDYSLPDVVTNEGIDNTRISRHVQGESLYMTLSDLQSQPGDQDNNLGSTSTLIQNKRTSCVGERKSVHIYYQPVPIMPDLQEDIQEDLPNLSEFEPVILNPVTNIPVPVDFEPVILNPVTNIPVPADLPQASDYYPVHIPVFQVPQETLPELDLYSDMPPHFSVYEVNATNNRRSLMPPMDGMSSTTTSIAGGSVYTLQGGVLEGDMVRDIDAEALYEQIEDRDRRSWVTSSSDTSHSSNSTSHPSTLAPLLSLVPSMESLGPGPVMFANVVAHQRENYDKIDRTKRAYNKPRIPEMEYTVQDYNTLVMWP
ncbi:uncharacterized protein [Amphiura filiformis]|uniref:uncharacterized protein n=1 Tax=Amphiura filiformis TaxID=82378 RepID=UPI003B20C244